VKWAVATAAKMAAELDSSLAAQKAAQWAPPKAAKRALMWAVPRAADLGAKKAVTRAVTWAHSLAAQLETKRAARTVGQWVCPLAAQLEAKRAASLGSCWEQRTAKTRAPPHIARQGTFVRRHLHNRRLSHTPVPPHGAGAAPAAAKGAGEASLTSSYAPLPRSAPTNKLRKSTFSPY